MKNIALLEFSDKTFSDSDHLAYLSFEERRLLLRAALGLFLKRLNHNIPVFRDDLICLADCADERPARTS